MAAVLVTGGAGFIGFHTAARLLKGGRDVIVYDNFNDYYAVSLKEDRVKELSRIAEEAGSGRLILRRADLTDAAALERVFTEYAPSLVIHLAAQAGVRYSIDHPDTYIESNIIGTFRILEACRHHPVEHLVYASSSSVYGGNTKVPFSEEDRVDEPVSLYAATKKSDELMAHAYSKLYGIPATGLRFFTVYGPWGRPDMAAFLFADKMMKRQPIKVFNNGDLERDFTYIDDIVEGILRVSELPPAANEKGVRHRVYNIGNHTPVKLMDFIAALERAMGCEAEKEFLPMQPGDVYRTCADVTALMRDTGFRPDTPLEDGLRSFADWYRSYYRTGQ
ncbi:MAG: NAD-dependent epimerase/dehydratase family protein [Lachnospiraceae bacterium]|nr:NAD-dependent epimerase/dehydratase family protein [Lachnospiraceae bacterium]